MGAATLHLARRAPSSTQRLAGAVQVVVAASPRVMVVVALQVAGASEASEADSNKTKQKDEKRKTK